MSSPISAIIYLAVLIGLFFLFRGINLWYWKINAIVNEQAKQSALLEKILLQIGGDTTALRDEKKATSTPLESFNIDEERLKVLKSNQASDEVIVRVKSTNQLQKINKKDWEDINNIGNSDKFDLID